ncbi:hypothetical protein FKM82_007464 [Ascaphus truei]
METHQQAPRYNFSRADWSLYKEEWSNIMNPAPWTPMETSMMLLTPLLPLSNMQLSTASQKRWPNAAPSMTSRAESSKQLLRKTRPDASGRSSAHLTFW